MDSEREPGRPGGGESPAGRFPARDGDGPPAGRVSARDGDRPPAGRFPARDGDGPPAGRFPPAEAIPMFDPVLDEIERRILRVFDPAGVLRL